MPRHIIMDLSGHSTFEFDRTSKLELAEAERRFNKLVGRGYSLPRSEVEAPITFQTNPHACSIRMLRKQFLFVRFGADDALGEFCCRRRLTWMYRDGAERI
jgi:hypothetical protein